MGFSVPVPKQRSAFCELVQQWLVMTTLRNARLFAWPRRHVFRWRMHVHCSVLLSIRMHNLSVSQLQRSVRKNGSIASEIIDGALLPSTGLLAGHVLAGRSGYLEGPTA